MHTWPNHLCASSMPTCSGVRPCERCYEIIKQRVLARALAYAGGPFTDRSSGMAKIFIDAYARAMHEHVEALSAEEAAKMPAQGYPPQPLAHVGPTHAAHPAHAPPAPAVPQGPLPCPAALGAKYPCEKPLGHCDHRGKQDKHVAVVNGQAEEWDEDIDLDAAFAAYGIVPQAAPPGAEGGEADAAPAAEENVAQDILQGEVNPDVMRSMGYVKQGAQWVKPPPPGSYPTAPQQTPPEAAPQAPEPQAPAGGGTAAPNGQ